MRCSDPVILAVLLASVACTPDPPTGETSTETPASSSAAEATDGATLGAEATTAGAVTETTSTAPVTTGTDETSGGGSSAGETTGGGSSGAATRGETESTESGESGGTESGESGESGESSTGPAPDGLVLDPGSLELFWLPINSLRAAVGGFDAATNTCVTVMFMFGDTTVEHCEFQPDGLFPYVLITPDSAPPCVQWDYGPNVAIEAVSGCMQVTSEEPLDISIDMTLEVGGGPFSGKITVKSP
jgi:hypothetical protein